MVLHGGGQLSFYLFVQWDFSRHSLEVVVIYIYNPTASTISYFNSEEGDRVGSLGAAMEEDRLWETDSEEYATRGVKGRALDWGHD